jgi:putative FmdB family regulatory protein
MPTYEYQCSQCDQIFEEFQKMTAPALTDCPKCGAKGTVRRLIAGGAGLIFKGSGFYATDYKQGGNGKSSAHKATSNESKPVECATCPAASSPDAPCKKAE